MFLRVHHHKASSYTACKDMQKGCCSLTLMTRGCKDSHQRSGKALRSKAVAGSKNRVCSKLGTRRVADVRVDDKGMAAPRSTWAVR